MINIETQQDQAYPLTSLNRQASDLRTGMDIEPGLERPAKRARPASSISRKVTALIITGAISSFLGTGFSASGAQIKVQHSEEAPATNSTSVWLNGLGKRNDAYDKRAEKGHWLFCIMNMSPAQISPHNQWRQFKDLEENGWSFTRDDFEEQAQIDQARYLGCCLQFSANKIPASQVNTYRSALDSLHIGLAYRNWLPVDNKHVKSGCHYRNMINLVDGVLTADVNASPDYFIEIFGEKDVQAPNLKRWSDVMFLNYQELQRQTGQHGKNLEHFFRNTIINDDTVETIRAARNGGDANGSEQNPPAWPGWEWNIVEKGAHAIMGTANGAGVAYFLAQHKDILGMRSVERIRAFNCYESGNKSHMCLYFHVADGPLRFEGDW